MFKVGVLSIISMIFVVRAFSYDLDASSGSLYDKYGGQAGVQKIVDESVGALLADPTVASYFVVIGQSGHDTADRLKSCLDLQFTVLMGGLGKYPGVSHYRNAPKRGYTCENMKVAHSDLGINNQAFDQFVMILGSVLQRAGVDRKDVDILAPTLLGLRSDVVTKTILP